MTIMIRWIVKIIDRAFAVVAAILFAQFPQFYSQYYHELLGHIGELAYQVGLLEQSAKQSGKTLKDLILKFLQFDDADIVRQGELMKMAVERLESLTLSQTNLENASIFAKPFLFIRNADASIAKETLHNFQFGFTFNVEGIAYAFLGLIIGYSIFGLIGYFFKSIGSLFRRKPTPIRDGLEKKL